MIKVLNIISDKNIGGAGRCILNFLKYYDRKSFLVKVVVPKDSLLVSEIRKLDSTAIEVQGIADKSFDVKAISSLYKTIKSEKPNIVHTHSVMSGKIAARLCSGTKIVYTRHSVFPVSEHLKTKFGKTANRMIDKILSDQIIAVAEAAKKNLIDSGISDKKIKVILNGVEAVKKLSETDIIQIRQNYGISESDFVIGILARLNEVKGHSYLIDAAKKIKRLKGNQIKIIIAGTGEMENYLKEQVKKLDLEDTVIFTGFVQDVSSILNIMDLQVNASFGTEATSLSLLEGMSLGIPAVVTDYGGNPGVIRTGENGLIVRTKDSEDLANGILRVIEDDGLRLYMKKRAVELFNKKFTANIYCRNIENVYRNMLRN